MAAAPTERLPALTPVPLEAPPARPGAPGGSAEALLLARRWWPAPAIAGVLCFVTFYAKGGLSLETMTITEMALTLAAGAAVAAATVLGRPRAGGDGAWSVGLLLALTALTALSVVWSVSPGASWQDAGRMLAYSGVFAAVVVFVRVAPERWPAVLGGVTLAAVVVCAYALATKVFPGMLPAPDRYARLREPYGYWNSIGLTAALGAICCLWLGARRTGHAALSALAYPAMGLMLVTLALAYSRGALAALAAGIVLWFAAVPLRLRGAGVLIAGGLAAAAVAGWDFSTHALSAEAVGLPERTAAGHRLGALLLAMLLVLAAAGVWVNFSTARRAPGPRMRRRAGAVLVTLIVLAVVAFAGALAHSHRGFTGSISHAVNALTDPNAKTPPNTPGRLTAVASVRARYWKEALEVWKAHPALGAGAMGYQTARLRYRRAPLVVAHAHGFVVQTLADLGLVGLGLALALLAAWMAAAGRATHPFDRSWTPWRAWRNLRGEGRPRPGWRRVAVRYTPERVGLLTMLAVVVVFGVHSLVDWTWYVPGNALVALLCAGWVAGRGALAPVRIEAGAGADGGAPAPADGHARVRARWQLPRTLAEVGHVRGAVAVAALAAALIAAWAQWQPLRSEEVREQALENAAGRPAQALAEARQAVSLDPVSALALITLADVQKLTGHPLLARATLQRAVREQPSNPQTWLALGRYDLHAGSPRAALGEIQAALYLDPESIAPELLAPARGDLEAVQIYNDYLLALRMSATPAATVPARTTSATGVTRAR